MTEKPAVKLSRLRDIGWAEWDPIGLLAEGDTWENKPFADEYDRYLLQVVALLRTGRREEECVDYLDWVGSEHMGLSSWVERGHKASKKTVGLIADYLHTL